MTSYLDVDGESKGEKEINWYEAELRLKFVMTTDCKTIGEDGKYVHFWGTAARPTRCEQKHRALLAHVATHPPNAGRERRLKVPLPSERPKAIGRGLLCQLANEVRNQQPRGMTNPGSNRIRGPGSERDPFNGSSQGR